MGHRRDRHGRGLRGPLLRSSESLGFPVDPRFRMTRSDRFTHAIDSAVDRVTHRMPRILHGISLGIEDVPPVNESTTHIALATAMEPSSDWPARIVFYRRPLEQRCDSHKSLETLIYRTLAEQLAALTGLDVRRIAPDVQDD